MSLHNTASQRGFTLIEVLIAVFVFATGLVMLGSLSTMSLNGTAASRYRGMATTFASEKLEDLNRWPSWDPHVCVSSGTVGSLTSDSQAASVTCNSLTETVDYYDDIAISDNTGQVCETVSSLSSGNEVYTSTCHTPQGSTTTSTSSTANSIDVGALAFHRRWTIEANQPVNGVKRITVLVTLENGYMNPPVSVQESMVRQCADTTSVLCP
jgi:prepilin-type N-terminal cleavage/methylation domain-containing protein